uniref:Uncharacterized protein n=1 Tax=Arundo donax TaxID=35708 RepID=A0A0A9ABJ9_ARUDO
MLLLWRQYLHKYICPLLSLGYHRIGTPGRESQG